MLDISKLIPPQVMNEARTFVQHLLQQIDKTALAVQVIDRKQDMLLAAVTRIEQNTNTLIEMSAGDIPAAPTDYENTLPDPTFNPVVIGIFSKEEYINGESHS